MEEACSTKLIFLPGLVELTLGRNCDHVQSNMHVGTEDRCEDRETTLGRYGGKDIGDTEVIG